MIISVSISDRALFLQYHVIQPNWYMEIFDDHIWAVVGGFIYYMEYGMYSTLAILGDFKLSSKSNE